MQFLDALGKEREFKVKLIDANAEPAKFRAVSKRVGRNTVPQIFLDDIHVGGWDDLARAASRGTLDNYFETGKWVIVKKQSFLKRMFRG